MEILSCSLCVSCSVGALAPCRARLAQWRPSVLSLPCLFFLVCTCALPLNIHLDSCDRTQAISLKSHIHCTAFNRVMSPTFVLMVDVEIGEIDAAATAQQTPVSLAELTQVWTLGVGSDRSLGRPKEWNDEPHSFDDFAFKFSNWLSELPGDAERFLEESVTMAQPIQWATLTPREKVVARRVATALRALIGGKALSCIRHHPEKLNGFEMWRLLYREYKPDTATRKVGLLERVMDDQPAPGMDFGDWFLRWLDLVGECEKARGRMIDDDIKMAVMLKRSPQGA